MIKLAIFERDDENGIDQAIVFYDDIHPDNLMAAQQEAADMLAGTQEVIQVATATLIIEGYGNDYLFPQQRPYIG